MVTQYDDKGKIFTQVISKRPVSVIVQTSQQRLRGTLHVRPSERIIDELNMPQNFVALTDGQILNPDGSVLHEFAFLSVNVEHIIWVIPADELKAE